MSHISESLPQKEIVVTVILDSNDVREKISGCAAVAQRPCKFGDEIPHEKMNYVIGKNK